jgi:hypothetical protein
LLYYRLARLAHGDKKSCARIHRNLNSEDSTRKMFNCFMNLEFLEVSDLLLKLTGLIKDFCITAASLVAVFNYNSQVKQQGIGNGQKLLDTFENNVDSEDVEIWKKICFNTEESHGVDKGKFRVFTINEDKREQIDLYRLFNPEGTGLILNDVTLTPGEILSVNCVNEKTKYRLDLSGVRRIAERLDLIGYEILFGNVQVRLIYYEIGEIFDSMYIWMDEIDDNKTRKEVISRFPHFVRMYRKYQSKFRKLPKKKYVSRD